jgi:hypothetical protein
MHHHTPRTAVEERCSELPFYYIIESPSSLNAVLHRVINLSREEREERIRLADKSYRAYMGTNYMEI